MKRNLAPVHPIVYLVIGLVVGISSIFINMSVESNFVIFVLLGFSIAAYGAVKMFIFGSSRRKDKSGNIAHAKSRNEPNDDFDVTLSSHESSLDNNDNANQLNFCPFCGARIEGSVNFCPFCGTRIN